MVEMNQDLVNQYFKNWVGVSTYNTDDYNRGPSCFGLYFLDFKSATSSYEFLREWQNWLKEIPIILSIVKENGNKYSFYFYKQDKPEFVKGTFDKNLDIKELEKFISNEKSRKYILLPRFPDDDDDIVDSYTDNVILVDGLCFYERKQIKPKQIENN